MLLLLVADEAQLVGFLLVADDAEAPELDEAFALVGLPPDEAAPVDELL